MAGKSIKTSSKDIYFMKTQDLPNDTKGEIVIYQSDEGKASIDVILQDETVWVTQEQMVAFLVRQNLLLVSILSTFLKKENWTPMW